MSNFYLDFMLALEKYTDFIGGLPMRSADQLKAIPNYIYDTFTNSDTPSSPLYAVIGITDNCNLNCKMCIRNEPTIKNRRKDMSFEQYKYIIDRLPSLRLVIPMGFGEPLLHKDIFKIIEYSLKKKIDVRLFTNGTLLNKKIAERLIAIGVTNIVFSIDGATPSTMEKIRKNLKFNEVIENIKYLSLLKKNTKSKIQIKFSTTLMRENIHELPQIVELAKELGVTKIITQDVQYQPSSLKLRTLNEEEKKRIRNIFKDAEARAIKYKIILQQSSIDQHKYLTNCTSPWKVMIINSSGFVQPCCGAPYIYLGNVFEEDPIKIWRNEKFVAWRKTVKSKTPPFECTNCTLF
jgi:radical SAM protein with 4Fe4S-binding SPASM domain